MQNKNNICILNYWWHRNNYGAILTAYALQQLLFDLNYNNLLVNNIIFNEKVVSFKYNFAKKFKKKYLKTTKELHNYTDFYDYLNNIADTFILGSDQVLRANALQGRLYQNMLAFVHPMKKKIAFSASFAVDKEEFLKETDVNTIEKMKLAFKAFDFISVREDSGVDICNNIFNVDAQWIIDPVFIVNKEHYMKLIECSTTSYKNTIISYVLDDNKNYDIVYKYLEEKYGTKVVKIANSNLSVENWLTAIKECKFLITDSFHGMCFAIIFNKHFICVQNSKRGGSRFNSILNMLNIENQCINSINDVLKKDCLFKIDYIEVNKLIYQEAEKAIETLKKVIHAEPKFKEEKELVNNVFWEDIIEYKKNNNKFIIKVKKWLWLLWLFIFYNLFPYGVKRFIMNRRKIYGTK